MIEQSLSSKHLYFKNRFIMPPMATAQADDNGHVSEDILKYYEDRAKSGLLAAVIVEHAFVEPRGRAHEGQMSLASDDVIPGMAKLAETIKKHGTLAIAQLAHAGSATTKAVIGMDPVAPSPVLNPATKTVRDMPKGLLIPEIHDIRNKYIAAAVRAKKAGFDAVEIHSAHGYLLDQFLSPLSNKRTDEYGKDIYGRIRLHLEIITGIKKELGEDFPVLLRMGAGDFREGGLTMEDAITAAKGFERAGIDVLDISGGMCFFMIPDKRPGYFDVLSKPIVKAISIPVILTGGVKKGSDIENILQEGSAHLVGVGRSLLVDANWPEREVGPLLNR